MHKIFVSALITFACICNTVTILAEDNDNRINIPVSQPLSLDTYDFPPFVFATADREQHRARITVTLAYAGSPELQREIEQKREELRNIISLLLGTKKYEELDTFEDVIVLSDEIKSRVNANLLHGKIMEVYFWDFMIE